MAFLRFNRDKRGYEHFYLVEATTNRRGKTRARVLYWYRTPPNVKVGRQPFDEDVRRALEQQNPGVVFDWKKIIETPIPSADVERWRERRRLERAEKAARRAEAAASRGAGEPDEPPDLAEAIESSEMIDPADPAELLDAGELDTPSAVLEEALGGPDHIAIAVDAIPLDTSSDGTSSADAVTDAIADATATSAASTAIAGGGETAAETVDGGARRRRRRRRRRRGRPAPHAGGPAATPPDHHEPVPEAPATDSPEEVDGE